MCGVGSGKWMGSRAVRPTLMTSVSCSQTLTKPVKKKLKFPSDILIVLFVVSKWEVEIRQWRHTDTTGAEEPHLSGIG